MDYPVPNPMKQEPEIAPIFPVKKRTPKRPKDYPASNLPSVVSEMKAWQTQGDRLLLKLKRYQKRCNHPGRRLATSEPGGQ
jgi:hypothetical protein